MKRWCSMKKITINYIDINSFSKFKKYKIINLEDKISFVISNRDFKKLSKEQLELLNETIEINYLLDFIKKYLVYIITYILILVALYIQDQSYREIRFKYPDTYNDEVISFINDNSNKYLQFNFLKMSLNELENSLQVRYPNYEFVGVEKNSSILEIAIKKPSDYVDNNLGTKKGDLVATKNGYVKGYSVERGIVLVETNQVVSAGDVLVSGNLLINKNGVDYVNASGMVFAETYSFEKVEVNKEEYEYVQTGSKEQYFKLVFFDKSFINNSKYEIYESEYKTIFEIKKLVKLIKVQNIEISEKYTIYDKEQAVIEGMNVVKDNYNSTKLDIEHIISCDSISIIENDDYYEITFLVKKYENIAEFREVE